MDGPNVNLNFCKEFSRLYKEENCHCLIDVGTCSLHTVHNSFRTEVEATGQNVKKVLKGAFHVFVFYPQFLSSCPRSAVLDRWTIVVTYILKLSIFSAKCCDEAMSEFKMFLDGIDMKFKKR